LSHHLGRLGGLGIRETSCKPGDCSEYDTKIEVRFVFLVNLDDETNEAKGSTKPQKKGEDTNHLPKEENVPWHSIFLRERVLSCGLGDFLCLSKRKSLDNVCTEP
jgi:hypothetical protein